MLIRKLLLLLLLMTKYSLADVIFTSERCNRVTFGLRTVNGDPGRYKQCGPSGRVWIVPCAPQMSFDPQDRVCKEDKFETRLVMRKYETHPKTIITTPAPFSTTPQPIPRTVTQANVEEFVFSTIRPKKPRIKTKKRRTSTTTTTTPIPQTTTELLTTTTSTTSTTTQPNIVIFSRPPKGGPAFSRPTHKPVTHPAKFVSPMQEPLKTTQHSETYAKPATLAPYQKMDRSHQNMLPEEPLNAVTVQPEYTVKYNGQSMTENEFLTHLLSMVKTQKMLAEKERAEKFEKMEQERLREEKEERERDQERRRQLEEMEKTRQLEIQRQAAIYAEQERMAAEREQEIARIRQEDRRREMEERKRKNEKVRQQLEIARKAKMEEERRRLVEEERVQREKALEEELRRRELEEERRREKQIAEMREIEEQRRRAAEEQARIEQMEKEKEIIRQMIEQQSQSQNQNQRNEENGAILQPVYRPEITEYQPPQLEMIRFTTTTTEAPWMLTTASTTVEEGAKVYQGCLVNGDCELKYNYDSFCQHPTNPSSYLQCAPLYGRHGRWTERHCPDTLQFVVSQGRCEKPEEPMDTIRRPPYDPDNRVVIPRLPSETEFIQWTGNRVIDSTPPQNRPIPRVYPPIPESEQPSIYSTIEEFPRDLLPTINTDNIHGSVISGQQQIQEQNYPAQPAAKTIDLSNIHPLFPRVQPDFLSRILPVLNLKLQDDPDHKNPNSIGKVVKPVLKQIALNQTEQFLDRLLADQLASQVEDLNKLRT
ncbi:unnamed protein product [Caenorhabditis angaria]|uniref:Chitin-binding type-2 domain-containing protein n=1 Tax=Caenorhabditis angaria TaxID=860376 RepID=A0A9P1IKJ1_9PELO|nr:unnamed protein product [Caenorhabditis angaria]